MSVPSRILGKSLHKFVALVLPIALVVLIWVLYIVFSDYVAAFVSAVAAASVLYKPYIICLSYVDVSDEQKSTIAFVVGTLSTVFSLYFRFSFFLSLAVGAIFGIVTRSILNYDKETVSLAIVCLVVIAGAGPFITTACATTYPELLELTRDMLSLKNRVQDEGVLPVLDSTTWFSTVENMGKTFGFHIRDILERSSNTTVNLLEYGRTMLLDHSDVVGNVLFSTVNELIFVVRSMLIFFATLVFCLLRRNDILSFVLRISPLPKEETEFVAMRVRHYVSAVVVSYVGVGAVNAFGIWLCLSISGFPFPALGGLLSGLVTSVSYLTLPSISVPIVVACVLLKKWVCSAFVVGIAFVLLPRANGVFYDRIGSNLFYLSLGTYCAMVKFGVVGVLLFPVVVGLLTELLPLFASIISPDEKEKKKHE